MSSTVPRQPPGTVAMERIAHVLRLGHFGPALIQRQFEWTEAEACKLLDNLERAHQRAIALTESASIDEPEYVAEASDEQGLADPDGASDDASNDASNDMAPVESDFDTTISEAEFLASSEFAAAAAPLDSFFVGTVILRRAAVNRHEIFDGLQRLTTTTVLLAVLRDQIEDEALRRELDTCINAPTGGRLALYGRDQTLTKHVQKPGATLLTTHAHAFYDVGRRILYVKNAIRARVEGWEPTKRESFARYLLDHVWLSVLTVPEQRMAQEMFVNTNLYGKPLDVIDVLKGQLVELISQSEAETELERFTSYWTSLRQESGDQFAEMLKAFDAIERCDIQTAAWPTDLGLHVSTRYTAARMPHFQNRMWAFMKTWKECRHILAKPGPSSIERDLWRLHVFRWPEWHPLALKWWLEVRSARKSQSAWRQNGPLLCSRFNRLHRRCMAISLAGFSETDRQKIFRNALYQDAQGRDVFQGALQLAPNQRRKIDRALRSQIHDPDIWAPLTRWLEMSTWRDDLPKLIARANTEHVRPRSVNWAAGDGPADDMQAYNEGCYSLGNLALVGRGANTRMLNDGFVEKRPILSEEADRYWLLRSVVADDAGRQRAAWTNETIMQRADWLRRRVWQEIGLKPPQ